MLFNDEFIQGRVNASGSNNTIVYERNNESV